MVVDVNKKELWFRAKRYGYGWVPITWQGWGIILMYVFAFMTDALYTSTHTVSDAYALAGFLPRFFILTVFLFIICEAKGEHAKWRWGKKDQIDRTEDFR